MKLIKPERGIYERLIEQYSLTPSECVFIDDSAANIEAAAGLSINTIHYIDFKQAYGRLKGLINA